MKDVQTDYQSWADKYGGYAKDMTLRDHFAAKALQGIIATNSHFVKDAEALASKAYEFADAMLGARK